MKKLLPFQREFIKAVENPKYDTVAISGPRTLGKTFIAAQVLIRCMTPGEFTSPTRQRVHPRRGYLGTGTVDL